MRLVRFRKLLQKSEFLDVVRRDFSNDLKFKNVFSHQNTIILKSRLQDNKNKMEISKQLDLFKYINRRAAVLVPLCIVDDVPSVMLTLRSSHLSSHSGQVSFPGGMEDDTDEDLIRTALRETQEEIGLAENAVDIWGQLPPLPGRNFDVLVTPIVGFCNNVQLDSLPINRHEVVEVFTSSLESLSHVENVAYTTFISKNAKYKLPVFLDQKHKIWGLTALILHQALQLLVPELFPYKFNVFG